MKNSFFEEMQEGRLVDWQTLFLAWYILQESKRGNLPSTKYGKGFIHPLFGIFAFCWRIPEQDILRILRRLTSKSCIKDLYIEGERVDCATDKLVLVSTKHHTPKTTQVPKSHKELIKIIIKGVSDEVSDGPDLIYGFYVLPDPVKLKAFIEQYLDNWKQNKMISPRGNVLSAEYQIELVVSRLRDLLKVHPSNLLFNWMNTEGLDFMATLLFLDSRGDLTIENFQLLEVNDDIGRHNELFFRVTVNDLFAKSKSVDSALIAEPDASKVQDTRKPDMSSILYTKDGQLLYSDFDPIFDLTPFQKLLCKIIFSEEVAHNFETKDILFALYGNVPTKNDGDSLKKLVKRLNDKIKLQFKIPEAVHYGAYTTIRIA